MKIKSILTLFFLVFFCPKIILASLLFVPSHLDAKRAKIVVVIHGCLQSAESMALGTGWNQIAELNNLVIIYPQVPEGSNPLSCWSWYLPENQRSDSGQLKTVFEEIKSVQRLLKLKNPDVFATGISSGAATVAGLLACFPNEFKAGAIHSGPSYGLAQTLEDGEKTLKEGPLSAVSKGSCQPRSFSGSILVIQGSADSVVNPSHGKRIISDFIGNAEAVATKEDATGDLAYSTSDYLSEKSGKGRLIMVQGLGHAWSGFAANLKHGNLLGPKSKIPTHLPFFANEGPSATNLIWEFFKDASRSPSHLIQKSKQPHKK